MKRRGRRVLAGVGIVLGGLALGATIAAATATRQILTWAGYDAATDRLVTGLLVTGTPDHPVLYVTSSDPRMFDDDMDTNSGVITRLTWTGSSWDKVDLVRGLPRSRADHATNGVALSPDGGTLYVAQGSNTSMGGISKRFRYLPEYALSGAILAVDLRRIGDETYDLPTLDDDSRAGSRDENDPFGGNQGKNQARLVPDGPVQIHAPGFRNPYDVLVTTRGRLYTIQNGANRMHGGTPIGEGPQGRCSHRPQGTGEYVPDTLHLIKRRGVYGGHPNPTRGNPSHTFNEDQRSPVPKANPTECDFVPAAERGAVTTFPTSTNGLAEYAASNLEGALRGDLVAVGLDGRVYRMGLNREGDMLVHKDTLLRRGVPLDVTTQPDDAVFPGTIWVVDYGALFGTDAESVRGAVTVLEPKDYGSGAGWHTLASTGLARQEVSYVQLSGKLYLAGGDTRHQVYDPSSDGWRDIAPLAERLDHIQGVALGGRIYYVGGLAAWPGPHASSVLIYDPRTDTFLRGARMPRGRGAGGVVASEGKIYYAGGLHDGVAVPWFDVYDPNTDRWSQLPDMPRARDHFQAVAVDGLLYAIGGRQVELGTELVENDAYDLGAGSWQTGLAPLPTPRGGFAAAVIGRNILVMGGEVPERALATVESYDTRTDTWRTLDSLTTARHGIQAATCGAGVYIAAGGLTAGGGNPTAAHEVYSTGATACGTPRTSTIRTETSGDLASSFAASPLLGTRLNHPTSLQFGPDGRLYVAQRNGSIKAYTIVRKAARQYAVVAEETIDVIRSIPNHDDDGSSATDFRSLLETAWRKVGL